jgi:hypothetical protein
MLIKGFFLRRNPFLLAFYDRRVKMDEWDYGDKARGMTKKLKKHWRKSK